MELNQEILNGCLQNDRKAQYKLYRLCHGFMLGICHRYANSKTDAVEMMNTAYIKLLGTLTQYDASKAWGAWVRTITVRVCIDEFRKQKHYRSLLQTREHEELQNYSQTFDLNTVDQKIEAEHIYTAMQRLPEMSRKVFNLFAIDGYSHKEIASSLGMSEGTSKWHVNHARNQLKSILGIREQRQASGGGHLSPAAISILLIIFQS